jgi:hypothetical protein
MAKLQKNDYKELLAALNKLKATVLSKGMPYNNVRTIDDTINVVTRVMEKHVHG